MKYAPARTDGLYPYVITISDIGRKTHRIEYASSLADAKSSYGAWNVTYLVTIRRAHVEDMPAEVTR